MSEAKQVRLTVNLPEPIVMALRQIAKRKGISFTEALRQAISTETFFDKEINAGKKILVEDKKGKIRQVVLR